MEDKIKLLHPMEEKVLGMRDEKQSKYPEKTS